MMKRTTPVTTSRSNTYRIIFTSITVVAVLSAAALVIFVFGISDFFLNRYAKERIERVFGEAYPGFSLRVGSIHYNVVKNYTECIGVALTAADSSQVYTAGSLSVSEIGWRQLIMNRELTSGVVKASVLNAQDVVLKYRRPGYEIHCSNIRISIPDSEMTAGNVSMQFAESGYIVRCGNLRASVADSEFSVEGVEIRPVADDEIFFSSRAFRRTRVNLQIAQGYLRRAPVMDLLQGKRYMAGSLDIFEPVVDLLVDREKPSDPQSPPPLMPAAALTQLGHAFHLDSIIIHDARVAYGERLVARGKPGVITFDSIQLSALGVGTAVGDTVKIYAKGRFMEAGIMSVMMKIPMTARKFSVSYTGSMTAMDGTTLNRFLETAEHTRITSASLDNARFAVSVERGSASGTLHMAYRDLYLTLLDKKSGSKLVLGKQLATLFANIVKIRGSNMPNKSGSMKIGTVSYRTKPGDTFINVIWFSLRSAMADVVGF
jgi:hypothetical protein